jgi:AcrR family transcriptional regulator
VIDLMERGEEITVSRVVAASGVSRAAIYRRWPSMTDLVAAALDRGREPYVIPTEGDLLENVLDAFTGSGRRGGKGYSEDRFRLRMRLAMSDRRVQRAYWRSHVAMRRPAMAAVLREGVARGELRADLDVEAGIDLINGAVYYQLVVRGASLDEEETRARCREAIRIAWRGMSTASRG